MARITLAGNPINTVGELPAVGSKAPDFSLTKTDLGATTLADYAGGTLVLNIFPSVDTPVCAQSVRDFNASVAARDRVTVLCVAADLPFAMSRFCGAEGLDRVTTVSSFRSPGFGEDYGVTIADGPLAGLLSRAVVVIDAAGTVIHAEQVPEIKQAPNLDAVLAVLG
jgi:thioredoxin-dependent peroxiredoxin